VTMGPVLLRGSVAMVLNGLIKTEKGDADILEWAH
jgi:hypothetical protein